MKYYNTEAIEKTAERVKNECDRIDSGSFRVITDESPILMCMHNAKRDEFILKPIEVRTDEGLKTWTPTHGMEAPLTTDGAP